MRLLPKNKFLVVSPIKNKKPEQNSGFILPDEHNQEPFTQAVVLEADSLEYRPDNVILFPTHMMEEVNINGTKLFFVPENAVYGVIT